jgi:hypothetical protein
VCLGDAQVFGRAAVVIVVVVCGLNREILRRRTL